MTAERPEPADTTADFATLADRLAAAKSLARKLLAAQEEADRLNREVARTNEKIMGCVYALRGLVSNLTVGKERGIVLAGRTYWCENDPWTLRWIDLGPITPAEAQP